MTSGASARPSTPFPTGVTLARVLAVGRWLTWLWMAVVVAVADNRSVDSIRPDDPSGPDTALRQPTIAWLAVAALLAIAMWATQRLRTNPAGALSPRFAAVEVVTALTLSALDGWVFDPGHVFETSQSLATQYPVIALASAGLAFGPWIAAALGLLVGPAEWWAAELNGFDEYSLRHVFSLVATSLFFAAVGALSGWLGRVLRTVEREIADQRARDEVAGVLHDTVLQTLALVERRSGSTDPDLAAAARRADRDLRSFLFGAARSDTDSLEGALRRAVEHAHQRFDLDGRVDVAVNVLDFGAMCDANSVDALARATAEAVTNALKHGQPTSIVVFAETDDDGDVFVSIRDDGAGFDVDEALTAGRRGLRMSIVERLQAVGGDAEIVSTSGDGTEVRLWTRPHRPDEEET